MSWLRFLRRKRSDAELQDEIETFLTRRDGRQRGSRNVARRGPAAGADKVGQPAEGARIVVGAELSPAVERISAAT